MTGSLRNDGTNCFALREHVGGSREFVPLPSFPKRKIRGGAGGTEEERGLFTHLVAYTYIRGDWRIGIQRIYFRRRFFQIKPLGVISRN